MSGFFYFTSSFCICSSDFDKLWELYHIGCRGQWRRWCRRPKEKTTTAATTQWSCCPAPARGTHRWGNLGDHPDRGACDGEKGGSPQANGHGSNLQSVREESQGKPRATSTSETDPHGTYADELLPPLICR